MLLIIMANSLLSVHMSALSSLSLVCLSNMDPIMHLKVDSILKALASEHTVRVVKVEKVGEPRLSTNF